MKQAETINYYNKISSILPPDEFEKIEFQLNHVPDEQLEAFWNIIVAGYSAEFALTHYVHLFNFLQDKAMDYYDALITFVSYPGLVSGIFLKKTRWFELN